MSYEDQIEAKIQKVKAAYREGQVQRRLGDLSESQRKKLTKVQNDRIARISSLGNLLKQRFKWN